MTALRNSCLFRCKIHARFPNNLPHSAMILLRTFGKISLRPLNKPSRPCLWLAAIWMHFDHDTNSSHSQLLSVHMKRLVGQQPVKPKGGGGQKRKVQIVEHKSPPKQRGGSKLWPLLRNTMFVDNQWLLLPNSHGTICQSGKRKIFSRVIFKNCHLPWLFL